METVNTSFRRRIQLVVLAFFCLIGSACLWLYPQLSRYSSYHSIRHAIELGNEAEAIRLIDLHSKEKGFDVNWTVSKAVAKSPTTEWLYGLKPGCRACSGEWQTLLHHAALYGRARVLQRLLELGSSVSLDGDQGWSALQSAITAESIDAIKLLLENGADLNAHGPRPLGTLVVHHASAFCDDLDVVEFLIDSGAALDAVDQKGWTPLDWASVWNTNAVPLLLSRGAVYGQNRRVPLPPPGKRMKVVRK